MEFPGKSRDHVAAVEAVAVAYRGRGNRWAAVVAARTAACRSWTQYKDLVEPLARQDEADLPPVLKQLMLDPPDVKD